MGLLEILLSSLGLPTVLTIIIFKVAIDRINMTGLEKRLLTDSEKLFAHLSVVTIISASFAIFIVIWSIITSEDFRSNSTNDLIKVFLGLLLIFFCMSIVLYTILFSFLYFSTIKEIYLVKDGLEEWKIVKRIDKNKLLLKSNDVLKIVKNKYVIDKEIFGEIDETFFDRRIQSFLYFNNKNNLLLKIILVITIFIATSISLYFDFIRKSYTFDNNINNAMQILFLYIVMCLFIVNFIAARDNIKRLGEFRQMRKRRKKFCSKKGSLFVLTPKS